MENFLKASKNLLKEKERLKKSFEEKFSALLKHPSLMNYSEPIFDELQFLLKTSLKTYRRIPLELLSSYESSEDQKCYLSTETLILSKRVGLRKTESRHKKFKLAGFRSLPSRDLFRITTFGKESINLSKLFKDHRIEKKRLKQFLKLLDKASDWYNSVFLHPSPFKSEIKDKNLSCSIITDPNLVFEYYYEGNRFLHYRRWEDMVGSSLILSSEEIRLFKRFQERILKVLTEAQEAKKRAIAQASKILEEIKTVNLPFKTWELIKRSN